MSTTDSSQKEKVRGLLMHFDTGMLVTHASEGRLRARPMAVAAVEEDCRLWFLTLHDSAKVHEIEKDTRVTVVCQKEHSTYVALHGYATLRRDRAKIDALWRESYHVWFPQGKADPELVLIEVDPEEAEYWDQRGMKGLRYFFESARAYASGQRPRIQEGEQHAKVNI